jgi:uncharacterized secreted protein with C-terminal beta-propeller domain
MAVKSAKSRRPYGDCRANTETAERGPKTDDNFFFNFRRTVLSIVTYNWLYTVKVYLILKQFIQISFKSPHIRSRLYNAYLALMTRAAAGTRVPDGYPGNLLPG